MLNEAKAKKAVKMLDYNRPIDTSLVNRLKESMNTYGVLSSISVYESNDEYLVDDDKLR